MKKQFMLSFLVLFAVLLFTNTKVYASVSPDPYFDFDTSHEVAPSYYNLGKYKDLKDEFEIKVLSTNSSDPYEETLTIKKSDLVLETISNGYKLFYVYNFHNITNNPYPQYQYTATFDSYDFLDEEDYLNAEMRIIFNVHPTYQNDITLYYEAEYYYEFEVPYPDGYLDMSDFDDLNTRAFYTTITLDVLIDNEWKRIIKNGEKQIIEGLTEILQISNTNILHNTNIKAFSVAFSSVHSFSGFELFFEDGSGANLGKLRNELHINYFTHENNKFRIVVPEEYSKTFDDWNNTFNKGYLSLKDLDDNLLLVDSNNFQISKNENFYVDSMFYYNTFEDVKEINFTAYEKSKIYFYNDFSTGHYLYNVNVDDEVKIINIGTNNIKLYINGIYHNISNSKYFTLMPKSNYDEVLESNYNYLGLIYELENSLELNSIFQHRYIYNLKVFYKIILDTVRVPEYNENKNDLYINLNNNYKLITRVDDPSVVAKNLILTNNLLDINYKSTGTRWNIKFNDNDLELYSLILIPDSFYIVNTHYNGNVNYSRKSILTNTTDLNNVIRNLDNSNSFNNIGIDKLEKHQKYYFSFEKDFTANMWWNDYEPIFTGYKLTNDIILYRYRGFGNDRFIDIEVIDNLENIYNDITVDLRDHMEYPLSIYTFADLNDLDYLYDITLPHGYLLSNWEVIQNEDKIILKAILVEDDNDINITFQSNNYTISVGSEFLDFKDLLIPEVIPGYKYNGQYKYGNGILIKDTDVFYFDTKIYPVSEKVSYFNVNFELNGGIYIAPTSIFINRVGEFASLLPEAEKTKAIFLGWFIDEELTIPAKENVNMNSIDDMIYYDITLYAGWLNNGAKIYFETNYSGFKISPIIITKGEYINIPIPPARPGYLFAGWYLDQELTIEYENTSFEDDIITLYAAWEIDIDNPVEDEVVESNEELYTYILIGSAVAASLFVLFKIFKKPRYKRRRR